jgi:PST family polysaccharide transporter
MVSKPAAAQRASEPTTPNEIGRRGARAAVQMSVRTALTRGLSFAATLALARLLTPQDFGLYAVISLVVWLFLMAGDLGLGAALIQQRDEPSQAELATVWTSQQVLATIAVAAIWLAAPLLPALARVPEDSVWMLRVLSLGLFAVSLRALPAIMLERQMRFGPLALSEILAQSALCVVSITLAVLGLGVWSFVLAALASFTVGAIALNLAWPHNPGPGFDVRSVRRLLGFGTGYQAGLVLSWLRDAPAPFIAAQIAGLTVAGLLDLALAIGVAAAVIDETIGRVLFPAFSRLQGRRAEMSRALDLAVRLTALVSVAVQCWLAAVAPVLVPLVFGSAWAPAAVAVQWVCIGILFRFPSRYMRQAAFAAGASRIGLGLAAAGAVLALGPLAAGLFWYGLPGAGAGYLLGSAATFALSTLACRRFVDVSWLPFGLVLVEGLVAGAAANLTLLILPGMVGLAAGSVVFTGLFGLLVLVTQRDLLRLAIRHGRQAVGDPDGSGTAAGHPFSTENG